ncbi:MAG: 6-pyruvoyl trahydropterin synthase family protein [Anaerolineae bacterium]
MDAVLPRSQEQVLSASRGGPPEPRLLMEIGVDIVVNSRHYVELGGRTGPLHDHSWRIEVVCQALPGDIREGVVVEFAVVRERVQAIARAWDGQVLNDLPAFRGVQPTVENAALRLHQAVRHALTGLPVRLASVTLWENPTHFVRLSEC